MGTGKKTARINRISGLLFAFLGGLLGFRFPRHKLCQQKTIKRFSMKLNKYWESFCYYVLVVPRTLFSFFNFSDNSVQLLSLVHSNVQLLYLLLFFAAVVDVVVLIA